MAVIMTRRAAIILLAGSAALAVILCLVLMRPRHIPPGVKPVAAPHIVEPTTAQEHATQRVQEEPTRTESETPAEEPPAEQGASISGRVTDERMNPIEGAELGAEPYREFFQTFGGPSSGASGGGASAKPAKSDARGNYRLTGVARNAKYVVFAKATGYVSAGSDPVVVPSQGDLTDIDFILERGATISGRVVDTRGECVPHADISLVLESKAFQASSVDAAHASTDEEGRFRMQEIGSGAYIFIVRAPREHDAGWRQVATNAALAIRAGEEISELDVVVYALDEGWIEGRARDENGKGISGVRVAAGQNAGRHACRSGAYARTDIEGHYRLEGLGEPAVPVCFSREGYPGVWLEDVPVGTRNADVVMATRPSTIQGYVTRRGRPVTEGGTVTAFPISGPEHQRNSSGIDPSGFYCMKDTPADTHTVVVEVPGRDGTRGSIDSRTVHVGAGQVVRVDFELGGTAGIRGVVSPIEGCNFSGVLVRKGQATDPFSFETWAALRAQALGWSLCDSDGTYQIGDLPPGTHTVTAVWAPQAGSPAADIRQVSRSITLKDGDELEVNFAP